MPPDQAHPAAQTPCRGRTRRPPNPALIHVQNRPPARPAANHPTPRNHQAIRSLTVTPTLTSPWQVRRQQRSPPTPRLCQVLSGRDALARERVVRHLTGTWTEARQEPTATARIGTSTDEESGARGSADIAAGLGAVAAISLQSSPGRILHIWPARAQTLDSGGIN